MGSLLEVQNLRVEYRAEPPVQAVDGISFQLQPGENLGLVGESGCGKTTVTKAIMGLLPRNGRVVGGSILWKDADLTRLSPSQLNKIRWREIALAPQSAMNSLDPVYRIRDQIVEAILAHEDISKSHAEERAAELCTLVGIDPERLNDFPHQLSGGMKQRLVIAMALALNPALLIADEPTTALDVIVQDRILQQIIDLQKKFNFAMIYISHDIAVIVETCHKIAVMYAGKIAEYGPIGEVLKYQAHPYTMGLKNGFPDIRNPQYLVSIPGHPPSLAPPPPGCRFASRCPFSAPLCYEKEPQLIKVKEDHYSACHFADKADEMRPLARVGETWAAEESYE